MLLSHNVSQTFQGTKEQRPWQILVPVNSKTNPTRLSLVTHDHNFKFTSIVPKAILLPQKATIPFSKDAMPSHWEEQLKKASVGKQRVMKRYFSNVALINSLEPSFITLTDQECRNMTDSFKARLEKGETLDSMLCEAFALVRETARRTLGLRHYDCQLVGGMVLHEGQVAEMMTGEGKTLTATLAVYLNALQGHVHVVTVNDYLAGRDAEWMGSIYRFLGLTVASVYSGMKSRDLVQAFKADITYVTGQELGFQYLRDMHAMDPDDVALPTRLCFALVDEVDSILIDESSTPMILSRAGANHAKQVLVAEKVTKKFLDYVKEETADSRETYYTLSDRFVAITSHGMAMLLVILGRDFGQQGITFEALSAKGGWGERVLKALADILSNPDKEDYEGRDSQAFQVAQKFLATVDKFLKNSYYETDEKLATVTLKPLAFRTFIQFLMDEGVDFKKEKVTEADLWEGDVPWGQFIQTALKAYEFFKKDKQYIVRDGEVVIVDQSTGRLRMKQRWQDGIHEAVEAKEGVKVNAEPMVSGQITFQVYFRFYAKLAGMSGTAAPAEAELFDLYGLAVVPIPTNRPLVRVDHPSYLFVDANSRNGYLFNRILESWLRYRPLLIGTTSVQETEELLYFVELNCRRFVQQNSSNKYERYIPLVETGLKKIQVLNASPSRQRTEAQVIAQAGLPGTVTIATNMAGRGTDIILGGSSEGLAAMGLLRFVLKRLMSDDANPEEAPVIVPMPVDSLNRTYDHLISAPEDPLEDYVVAHLKEGGSEDLAAKLTKRRDNSIEKAMAPKFYDELKLDLGWEAPPQKLHMALLEAMLQAETHRRDGGAAIAAFAALFKSQGLSRQSNDAKASKTKKTGPWLSYEEVVEQTLSLMETAGRLRQKVLTLLKERYPGRYHGDLDYDTCTGVAVLDALEEYEQQMKKNKEVVEDVLSQSPSVQRLRTMTMEVGTEDTASKFRLLCLTAVLHLWMWLDIRCEINAKEVREVGGLLVIGTSVSTTARTELQLRGRAGRQGDPGESMMLYSLDDPTLVMYGGTNTPFLQDATRSCISLTPQAAYLVGFTANVLIKNARRVLDSNYQTMRLQNRNYDRVMQDYRSYLYALRHDVLVGGPQAVDSVIAMLVTQHVDHLVQTLLDPRKPPVKWLVPGKAGKASTGSSGEAAENQSPFSALIRDLYELVNPPQSAQAKKDSSGSKLQVEFKEIMKDGQVKDVTMDRFLELRKADVEKKEANTSGTGSSESSAEENISQVSQPGRDALGKETSAALHVDDSGILGKEDSSDITRESPRERSSDSTVASPDPERDGDITKELGEASEALEANQIGQVNTANDGAPTSGKGAEDKEASQKADSDEKEKKKRLRKAVSVIEIPLMTASQQANCCNWLGGLEPLIWPLPHPAARASLMNALAIERHRQLIGSRALDAGGVRVRPRLQRPEVAGAYADIVETLRDYLIEVVLHAFFARRSLAVKQFVALRVAPNEQEAWSQTWRAMRMVYLEILDGAWSGFLEEAERLRRAVAVRVGSQEEALMEFRIEANRTFLALLEACRDTSLATLITVTPEVDNDDMPASSEEDEMFDRLHAYRKKSSSSEIGDDKSTQSSSSGTSSSTSSSNPAEEPQQRTLSPGLDEETEEIRDVLSSKAKSPAGDDFFSAVDSTTRTDASASFTNTSSDESPGSAMHSSTQPQSVTSATNALSLAEYSAQSLPPSPESANNPLSSHESLAGRTTVSEQGAHSSPSSNGTASIPAADVQVSSTASGSQNGALASSNGLYDHAQSAFNAAEPVPGTISSSNASISAHNEPVTSSNASSQALQSQNGSNPHPVRPSPATVDSEVPDSIQVRN